MQPSNAPFSIVSFFKDEHNLAIINKLKEYNVNMVYLGSNVEYEDLVSYGTFGLIDAIDKFDIDDIDIKAWSEY